MRARRRALRRHWRDWRKAPRWQRNARRYVRNAAFYDRIEVSSARYLLVASGAPLVAAISGAHQLLRPEFVSFAWYLFGAFIAACVAWGSAMATSLRFAALKDSVERNDEDMRRRLHFYEAWSWFTALAEAVSVALLIPGGWHLLGSLAHFGQIPAP
jgi:hypothetical protein